jgi:precorrin-2 dehydrogenase/sirohydrochlorin ferrochelatase
MTVVSAADSLEVREPPMERAPIPYYPMLLDLRGRRCLVVGGGREAEVKAGGLTSCGANVTVVAPTLSQTLESMAELGSLGWTQRPFLPHDLEGMFLVVAANDDPVTNRRIAEEARRCGVLCTVATDGSQTDFIVPDVVQRGSLTIALTTAGTSPTLTQRIREELERAFGVEYAHFLDMIRRLEPEIHETIPDRELRERVEAEMVDSPALAFLRGGNVEAAERILRTIMATAKGIYESQVCSEKPYQPGR